MRSTGSRVSSTTGNFGEGSERSSAKANEEKEFRDVHWGGGKGKLGWIKIVITYVKKK